MEYIPNYLKVQFYLGTITVVVACAIGIWIRIKREK